VFEDLDDNEEMPNQQTAEDDDEVKNRLFVLIFILFFSS
jgi:hypothetical protein